MYRGHKKYIIIVCAFLLSLVFFQSAFAQERTLIVKDITNEEPVVGCILSYTVDGKVRFVFSSSEGKFIIDVDPDETLQFSHISYKQLDTRLSWIQDNTIYLKPKQETINSATIYSSNNKQLVRGNSYIYTPSQAISSISIVGEPDVLRHISSLPGVSQGIEGMLGLFVRGGNNGSNGLYYSDVPLYVSTHALGLISVFPAEMIGETAFYMGGISASRGNQSSSVLDISLKKQYGTKNNGKISLSPYLFGGYTSIPIVKDKMSLQISLRSSFLPYIVKLFNKSTQGANIDVVDFSASMNYRISGKNQLDAMVFVTNDDYDLFMSQGRAITNWGGFLSKIGLNTNINDKLKMYSWIYSSSALSMQAAVMNDFYNPQKIDSKLALFSTLNEYSANTKVEFKPLSNWKLLAGTSFQFQEFKPGNSKYLNDEFDDFNEYSLPSKLLSLYAEGEWNYNEKADFSLGYRQIAQFGNEKPVFGFDAHLLSHIYFSKNLGLEFTLDRMNQFYHVLEGLPTG